jgi:hypothetical protein
MLKLTDTQIAELRTVARHIPRGLRSAFLQRFAQLLQDHADPRTCRRLAGSTQGGEVAVFARHTIPADRARHKVGREFCP